MLYRIARYLLAPIAWWGRLHVEGLDAVPERGAALVAANHDSHWDPLLIALALRDRREVRYLGKSDLWQKPLLGHVLDALRQIPIERGGSDADALDNAVGALRAGELVCIFPEGGLADGERQRARSGVGRLVEAVPEAKVLLCAVDGTTQYRMFPRRPRVTVRFFAPSAGQPRDDEEPKQVAKRLVDEVRVRVPPAPYKP